MRLAKVPSPYITKVFFTGFPQCLLCTLWALLQALEKLQKLVQQQVGLTKQMALMRGISEQLASQAVLPYSNRQADALYSVELLDFRIH